MKVYLVFGPEFFCGVYSTLENAEYAITEKYKELDREEKEWRDDDEEWTEPEDRSYYTIEETELDGELEYFEEY